MKEVFILLLVFGVVKSGYLPPEKDFGYYGHDQDISRIFQRLDALERRVGDLEAENRKLKEENALKSQCDCKSASVKNATSDDLKGSDETKDFLRSRDSAIKRNGAVMNVQQKQKRLLVQGSTGTTAQIVAFRADLSKPLASVGVHQVIEYDFVPLNIGNAYDVRHGHFTAPVKGLYLVTATAFSNPGKRVLLELVLNGQRIAVLDTGTHTSYSSNCKTLPVNLEQGDMVWVRTYPGQEGEYVGGYGDAGHNMFAAVLIAAY